MPNELSTGWNPEKGSRSMLAHSSVDEIGVRSTNQKSPASGSKHERALPIRRVPESSFPPGETLGGEEKAHARLAQFILHELEL